MRSLPATCALVTIVSDRTNTPLPRPVDVSTTTTVGLTRATRSSSDEAAPGLDTACGGSTDGTAGGTAAGSTVAGARAGAADGETGTGVELFASATARATIAGGSSALGFRTGTVAGGGGFERA